jgi:ParB family chromosome partitioning protein
MIKRSAAHVILDIDENAAPAFGSFLVDQLPSLYRAFRSGKSEGT